MSTFTLPTHHAATSPCQEVASIYRRICLLRVRGHLADAAQLESTALPAALAAAELAHTVPPEFARHMRTLFQAEEERIQNAAVLAELLLPLLGDHLGLRPAVPAAPAAVSRSAVRPATFNAAPTTSEPEAIADLIEGMLDQQRPARRR